MSILTGKFSLWVNGGLTGWIKVSSHRRFDVAVKAYEKKAAQGWGKYWLAEEVSDPTSLSGTKFVTLRSN